MGRIEGIDHKTAWLMWKAGKLSVAAEQLATGTIIVKAEEPTEDGVGLVCQGVLG